MNMGSGKQNKQPWGPCSHALVIRWIQRSQKETLLVEGNRSPVVSRVIAGWAGADVDDGGRRSPACGAEARGWPASYAWLSPDSVSATQRLVPKSPSDTLLTGFRGKTGRICLAYTSFMRVAVPS